MAKRYGRVKNSDVVQSADGRDYKISGIRKTDAGRVLPGFDISVTKLNNHWVEFEELQNRSARIKAIYGKNKPE